VCRQFFGEHGVLERLFGGKAVLITKQEWRDITGKQRGFSISELSPAHTLDISGCMGQFGAIEPLGQHAPDTAQETPHVMAAERVVVGGVNCHGTLDRSSVNHIIRF
jgi:hypothetical protein